MKEQLENCNEAIKTNNLKLFEHNYRFVKAYSPELLTLEHKCFILLVYIAKLEFDLFFDEFNNFNYQKLEQENFLELCELAVSLKQKMYFKSLQLLKNIKNQTFTQISQQIENLIKKKIEKNENLQLEEENGKIAKENLNIRKIKDCLTALDKING